MSKRILPLLLSCALLTGCSAVDSMKSFFSSDDSSQQQEATPYTERNTQQPGDHQHTTADSLSPENKSSWKMRYE